MKPCDLRILFRLSADIAKLVGPDQINLLLAVASAHSFSGAAKRLGVSQPSISQQIKRLESLVGQPLFRRTHSGVEPTAEGDAVIIYGRAVLGLSQDLQRQLDGLAGRVRINIGMSEDFVRTALPAALWLFMREHPAVEMRIVSGSYETLIAAIEARSVDFAVMRRHPLMNGARRLWSEPATWVGSDGLQHPLEDPVPLVLPVAPNPARDMLIEALRAAGRTWRVRFESPSMASIEAAMQARLGIGGAARSTRLYGVGALDATRCGLPPLPDIEFAMVETEQGLSGPVAAFAEILHQMAASSYADPDSEPPCPTT